MTKPIKLLTGTYFLIAVDLETGKAKSFDIEDLNEFQCRNLILGIMGIKDKLADEMAQKFPHWTKK